VRDGVQVGAVEYIWLKTRPSLATWSIRGVLMSGDPVQLRSP
jgi:hypothetical protein